MSAASYLTIPEMFKNIRRKIHDIILVDLHYRLKQWFACHEMFKISRYKLIMVQLQYVAKRVSHFTKCSTSLSGCDRWIEDR